MYVSATQLYVEALTGCMVYASTRLPAKPPALVENKKWKKKFFRFISVTFAIILRPYVWLLNPPFKYRLTRLQSPVCPLIKKKPLDFPLLPLPCKNYIQITPEYTHVPLCDIFLIQMHLCIFFQSRICFRSKLTNHSLS